jgi:acyl-CoA thioester hydrolase
MPMLEVLRSSVNPWECDRMGHLNVRHYLARAADANSVLLLKLGLAPSQLREQGLLLRARDQHVRFHRELRPGAVYTMHAGVIAESSDALFTYQELRTSSGDVSATVLSELCLRDVESQAVRPLPAQLLAAAHAARCEVPAYGAPRGIGREPAHYSPTHTEAIERGFIGAFLGPLLVDDCDERGVMRESACMARISDGIPHFFRALNEGPRPSGIGGAAVEYRFVFQSWPRAADVIEVRSALRAVGNKTLHMNHFIFNVETGVCVASSEAIAVWFDLTARKAVEMPAEVRAELVKHVMPGLSL